MPRIVHAETSEEIGLVRHLFREYESWLGLDLCFQGFEEELANLPGKYAEPGGRLLLCYAGERLAGCAALRPLGPGICEMKRLFVRDEFRGQSLGNLLVEYLIAEAHLIGYQNMRLDTLPLKMPKAVVLYQRHGFRPITPYYDNPHTDVTFMEKDL